MDLRELKGLELAARARITFESGAWQVPSQTSAGTTYRVTLKPPTRTCEDWALRREPCKHVHAAQMVCERTGGEKAPTLDTDAVPTRPTYRQDWPAYTVRLWDVATGKDLLTLAGHGAALRCLGFSPDGSLLASGSADGGVKLWDTRTGLERVKLAGHADAVTCLAFCPTGGALASAATSESRARGEVRLWDVSRGELKRELPQLVSVVALAFTEDGRTLATANGGVQLWDATTGAPGPRFAVPGGGPWWRALCSLAFAADGVTLLCGTEEQTVQGWRFSGAPWPEVGLGKELLRATAWPLPPTALAFSPDGGLAAAVVLDGRIEVLDLASGRTLKVLSGHAGEVRALACAPGGALLASGGEDRTVRLWAVPSGRLLRTLRGHGAAISALAFTADGRRLASATGSRARLREPGEVKVWDVAGGKAVRTFRAPKRPVLAVAISPDGALLAAGDGDNTTGAVRLWDVKTGASRRVLSGPRGAVSALALTADGKAVAAGAWDGAVRVWDVRTGDLRRTLRGGPGAVNGLAFAAGGQVLLSGGKDGVLRRWDLAGGGRPHALPWQGGPIRALAVVRNGKALVCGGENGGVREWAEWARWLE
jgi:WD40 repeat protein